MSRDKRAWCDGRAVDEGSVFPSMKHPVSTAAKDARV